MLTALPVVVFLSVADAQAQTDVPDLRGTWTLTTNTIGHVKGADRDPAAPHLGNFILKVEITFQDGIRFAGRELDQDVTAPFDPREHELHSGIFGFDGTTAYIVDDNGFYNCTSVSAERMECIYRHLTPTSSLVAQIVWERDR